jgi:phosphohistidine phosphatase
MKRVWVMRHAKAERDGASLPDVERPLAKRGVREAAGIGRWLAAHGGPPDLLASSPAVRARETAELVAREAGYRRKPAAWPLLYPGGAAATLAELRGLDDSLASVLLVTHNPHAEDLVALLAGGLRVRMATSALALLEADAEAWSAVAAASMSLSALVSPATL